VRSAVSRRSVQPRSHRGWWSRGRRSGREVASDSHDRPRCSRTRHRRLGPAGWADPGACSATTLRLPKLVLQLRNARPASYAGRRRQDHWLRRAEAEATKKRRTCKSAAVSNDHAISRTPRGRRESYHRHRRRVNAGLRLEPVCVWASQKSGVVVGPV
jgi:hypothetical protein